MKQKLTEAASGKTSQSEAEKKTPPTQAKPTNQKPATTPGKPANQASASPSPQKTVDITVRPLAIYLYRKSHQYLSIYLALCNDMLRVINFLVILPLVTPVTATGIYAFRW